VLPSLKGCLGLGVTRWSFDYIKPPTKEGMSGRRGLIRLCGFGRVVSRITRLFRGLVVGSRMVVGGMNAG